jgi:hypothetical protein
MMVLSRTKSSANFVKKKGETLIRLVSLPKAI